MENERLKSKDTTYSNIFECFNQFLDSKYPKWEKFRMPMSEMKRMKMIISLMMEQMLNISIWQSMYNFQL